MDIGTAKRDLLNIIFSRTMPNYVIPIPTNEHKIYKCKECGDGFIFESSYNYHIHRKSMVITYACRPCGQTNTYYNRCNLLSHIRSHTVRTATINVADLTLQPLPYNSMKKTSAVQKDIYTTNSICLECKNVIQRKTKIFCKDRAAHYMKLTDDVHTCPICLFTLPSLCGMKTHMRIHLKEPPYICPECGVYLTSKNGDYPYNHDCEGFRMMRATARLQCPMANCELFHPSYFEQHIKEKHFTKVFKCPVCFIAGFNENNIKTHLSSHNTISRPFVLYKCEICQNKLIESYNADIHLKSHNIAKCVYPCWMCGVFFKNVTLLLTHHSKRHDTKKTLTSFIPSATDTINQGQVSKTKIYRVEKRCGKCGRCFAYKCKYDKIKDLPTNCPYNCVPDKSPTNGDSETIICHLCKDRVPLNWNEIKKHYVNRHPQYKCRDVQVSLTRLNDIPKIKKKKRKIPVKKSTRIPCNSKTASLNKNQMVKKDTLVCTQCDLHFTSKEEKVTHVISHRDRCMAYQCMECGQCFVVKSSFSTHLLLNHNITDVEDYIIKNPCYNKDALIVKSMEAVKHQEPLNENQCSICREQYDDMEDLKKHFRVHGMAFILKNSSLRNDTSS